MKQMKKPAPVADKKTNSSASTGSQKNSKSQGQQKTRTQDQE